jgi:hypothetical protein
MNEMDKKELKDQLIKEKKEELETLRSEQEQKLQDANQEDDEEKNIVENPKEGMMEDFERRARVLDEIAQSIERIEQINTAAEHSKVVFGTVVETTGPNFYIAIPHSKPLQVGKKSYFCVSENSPLYEQIKNMKVGDSFEMKGKTEIIQAIY